LCPQGAKQSNSTFLLENPDANLVGGEQPQLTKILPRQRVLRTWLKVTENNRMASAWETGILQAVTPTRTTIPTSLLLVASAAQFSRNQLPCKSYIDTGCGF
jgi:hypothetical protein